MTQKGQFPPPNLQKFNHPRMEFAHQDLELDLKQECWKYFKDYKLWKSEALKFVSTPFKKTNRHLLTELTHPSNKRNATPNTKQNKSRI